MSVKGMIDAIFILRRLQEEHHARGKMLHVCFVDQEKTLYRVPKKVFEKAMRQK